MAESDKCSWCNGWLPLDQTTDEMMCHRCAMLRIRVLEEGVQNALLLDAEDLPVENTLRALLPPKEDRDG